MPQRVTTLLCALGAALLLATLLVRGDTLAGRRASLPMSTEQADNGLLGVKTWLEKEGIRTLALRRRFGALSADSRLSSRGNLLILSLPAVTSFRPDEAVALDRWVRDGNTLLVLAALRDRPGWAQFPFAMASDLQLITELRLAPLEPPSSGSAHKAEHGGRTDRADETAHSAETRRPDLKFPGSELATPQQSTLLPNRAHPYFSGVAHAVAFSDYAPVRYTLAIPRDGFALSLGHEAGSAADAFWMRPHGAGTILVSGFGTLFSNRALGKADNARLLANVIASGLGPDGTVVLDDEHQGLSDDYDPARFYRDRRLYATCAVIIAVWLAWVTGSTRLRPPGPRRAGPREAELVRTTGLYLARVLRPAAAARRLLEQFLARLSGATGGSSGDTASLWHWLESHPCLTNGEARELRAWHAAACADRRVPLIRLHNLIVHTERQLAQ